MPDHAKVSLFIIGAPKSGTTALYEYLRTNPDFFFPSHKEPHYFATDFANIGGRITSLENYEKIYNSSKKGQILGDASVCYLASETAIGNIYDYNPEAKLVAILRNPVDLFLSEHSQLLYSFYETEKDPLTAWQLQQERKEGRSIPSCCREVNVLQYRMTCSHGANIQRALKYFPRKQLLVIFFDDFIRNPQRIYREILTFTGAKDDGREDFPPVNERKSHTNNFFSKMLISPPGILGKWHMKLRQEIAISNNPALKYVEKSARALLQALSSKEEKMTLSPIAYQTIQEELLDDICLLETLTGKDLHAWKGR